MTEPDAPCKSLESQRGIALLITLAFIAVLIATALELNRRMRTAVESAAEIRDLVTAKAMASSGVHGAMALLVADKRVTLVDSVQEIWADSKALALLLAAMPFEEGELTVGITDELSRIQVNALVDSPDGRNFNPAQKILWLNFLDGVIPKDARDANHNPESIVDCVKDWIDSGDDDAITGLNGAESGYYKSLDPPYGCPDRYFADPAELARVKGISRKLYAGDAGKPGISDFVTVFGVPGANGDEIEFPGRININTAKAPVLKALFGPEYQDQVEKVLEYRAEKAGDDYVHDLSKKEWYKSVPGFRSAKIDPELVALKSDLFRIEAVARVNETRSTVIAVVHRQKAPKTKKMWCKILNWQVK